MSRRWIRIPPGRRENGTALIVAGVVAAGVGVATFFFTRLLLAREPLGGTGVPGPAADGPGGEDGAVDPSEEGGA